MILAPHLLHRSHPHVTVRVTWQTEVLPNRLGGEGLAGLCGTSHMFTESGLEHTGCAANVLWATHPCITSTTLHTLTSSLHTTDAVYQPSGLTVDKRCYGEGLPSLMAGVGDGIHTVVSVL